MLALQAATVIVPPLRSLLRTTPLGAMDLAVVGAGAVTPLLVREALKSLGSNHPKPGGSRG
jgi:P-type Ca2+ transporter type 2C